jgi:uncharacterized membrane protein HdeD (DUF308 family)
MAEEQQQDLKRPRRYSFIPAGALIGLGLGLLLGFPASGVLIGLGLGFLASAVVAHAYRGRGWPFSGIIFILIGVGLFLFPSSPGYVAAILVILLGAWFLVRGFVRKR